MAYGRIRRTKVRDRIGSRSIHTVTYVGRDTLGASRTGRPRYMAYTCLARTGGSRKAAKARGSQHRTYTNTCTRDYYGRSPQSAIAKALKTLSSAVALRGRKYPTYNWIGEQVDYKRRKEMTYGRS